MAFGLSYQFDCFCGWRYLFSANYRDLVKQKWGKNLMLQSVCLVGGFVSILVTSAAVVLLIQLAWFLITENLII